MIPFRSQKTLFARLKLKPDESELTSATPLGDWHVDLLYFERQQVVLFTTEKSRPSLRVEARDAKSLRERLLESLRELLLELDLPPRVAKAELEEMRGLTVVAKAYRAVRQRDLLRLSASYLLHERGMSLLQASLGFRRAPCIRIDGVFPLDVARGLLRPREWERLKARLSGLT